LSTTIFRGTVAGSGVKWSDASSSQVFLRCIATAT
jgi:hypothetical protein